MKIAVTGASGHVGNNICRALTEQGHHVKALIHLHKTGLDGLPLEFVKGDVGSESDLKDLCSGCETVIHLAGRVSIRKNDPECIKVNRDGCINLIKAARSTGIKKIIHFSSVHAFRYHPGSVLDETCELSTGSEVSYDHSKALGQKIMLEASSRKLETVVLNPTAIIGPNDFKPSLSGSALIRFYKGDNPVLVPGGYNWVDVRDLCTAVIQAINRGESGECYLLGGSWQSVRDLAMAVEQLGGHAAPRMEIPMWIAKSVTPLINLQSWLTRKSPLYTTVSLQILTNGARNISYAKAGSVLGFHPRPFTETLADTLAWFRNNHYI